jgi:hypothetical protein
LAKGRQVICPFSGHGGIIGCFIYVYLAGAYRQVASIESSGAGKSTVSVWWIESQPGLEEVLVF